MELKLKRGEGRLRFELLRVRLRFREDDVVGGLVERFCSGGGGGVDNKLRLRL